MNNKKEPDNTPNLFDLAEENNIDLKLNQLEVVNAKLTGVERRTWQELFEGYNELFVITFSSGVDFTAKLIDQFEYAEIVYGCDAILPDGISAVMSVEQSAIKQIVKSKSAEKMAARVKDGSLKLYVSRDTRSHEKIFCLKANDGRVRVITGSANMSATAFGGVQRENILCFDDQDAYDHYYEIFRKFADDCSDNISDHVIAQAVKKPDEAGENIDELPITEKIKKEHVVYLETQPESAEDKDVIIAAEIKGHEEELRKVLPKQKKSGNAIVISTDDLKIIRKKTKENTEWKKAIERVNPKLHIDYENRTMSFNGVPYNLTPESEQIKNDVSCLESYLDSLNKFNGDWQNAQKNYYMFMNWYFCSVFMAYLRDLAYKNHYETLRFPVVGIIFGNSNGGKSTFIKLLEMLMCGKVIPFNHTDDFTSTKIEGLKSICEGLPIYIDDLARTQYTNHSEKVIKNDNWGIKEHMINYPAIAFSTNKLPAVSPDISKRAVTCRINAKISNANGAKASKKVTDAITKASTALFSAYVSQMFERISDMENLMKQGAEDYFPDILKESSDVLKQLIIENSEEDIPSYVQDLSYFSYFGDSAIGQQAIKKIRLAWENEPKRFTVNKKKNTLTYSFPDNAYFDMKYIADELPPTLNAQLAAGSLVMNLKEAQAFFGYAFKRSLFGKIL